LPYAPDALEPAISAETLKFHHGKHHGGYVKKLNKAVEGTEARNVPAEELIKRLDRFPLENPTAVFNNAAQHYNHSFYWKCLGPSGGDGPSGSLATAVNETFGGVEALREKFTAECAGHFGSGWGWLVKTIEGNLEVISTHDAETPLRNAQTPLLTCDVWEHAYYLDYQNARPDYLQAFWKSINWEFVAANFEG
jgi:Fe-Mn family superoxide dismutase